MALLTRVAGAASRIFRPRGKQFGGPFMLPVGPSGIPPSWPANWFQLGYDPLRPSAAGILGLRSVGTAIEIYRVP